jgi:capsular polysaccharide biosynthesis protein
MITKGSFMELLLIGRVLLRRWYLVLIPVIVAAMFIVPRLFSDGTPVASGFTTTVQYTAAQVLEAIPERDGDYQDVWLASELTVNAFTEWIKSSRFAQEVSAVLAEQGYDIPAAMLGFATDNARSVGRITVNWHDAAQLEAIVHAAVEVLQTRSADYFPQLGTTPARVTLLDEPRIFPAPPPLTNRLMPLLQLGMALMAGIGLAFLVEYLDPILRRKEQLTALHLPVIGTIPRE